MHGFRVSGSGFRLWSFGRAVPLALRVLGLRGSGLGFNGALLQFSIVSNDKPPRHVTLSLKL